MSSRRQDKVWQDFVAWCRARRLKPLPAHPWTLAAYARWCESRHRFPSLAQRIRAIARRHVLSGAETPDRHPLVTRTLDGIETREQLRSRRADLFPGTEAEAEAEAAPAGRKTTRKAANAIDLDRAGRRRLRATPPLVTRRPQPQR